MFVVVVFYLHSLRTTKKKALCSAQTDEERDMEIGILRRVSALLAIHPDYINFINQFLYFQIF